MIADDTAMQIVLDEGESYKGIGLGQSRPQIGKCFQLFNAILRK